ncbi:MAG: hypothetical protein K0S00_4819 [Xanthobacteraceae bacterium]|jgi:hypothetical protein|nr:hypothetical protein [Xanthobacteraceae bacterium]
MNATEQQDHQSERPLVLVPDANVLIHGKALVDMPWEEFGRPKVEVLFVPPMVRELDKLKTQTGRQNKLARQLSSDIRSLISAPNRSAEIREVNPAVIKRLELRAVTESLHPALRLDHADQALINYILWLRQEGNDVLLLTDDTICGTTAHEVGLPVRFLPEAWLRPPEPDESARENARLKAEVQRLTAAEPKVELRFQNTADTPLTELRAGLTRWPALSDAEIGALIKEVERLCPQAISFDLPQPRAIDALAERIGRISRPLVRSIYEPATEEEIERYKTIEYPEWLETVRSVFASLHHALEIRTEWPRVVAVAANRGTRPATEALLTIQARGAITLLNEDDLDEDEEGETDPSVEVDRLELPLPPTPPRGRTKTFDPLEIYRGLNAGALPTISPRSLHLPHLSLPTPRESDAFYWRAGRRDWSGTMELECASWRHGQDPIRFVLRVRPKEQVATSAAVEISVHAHNITKPQVVRLPVQFDYEDGSTFAEGLALVELLGHSAGARRRL